MFSQVPPGTLSTLYDRARPQLEPTTLEGVDSINLHTQIVSADTLRAWSPEELRLVDYQDKWIPAKYVPMWLKREKLVEDVLRRLPGAASTD